MQRVHADPVHLAKLCRRYHVQRLFLFGSVLRDDFGPASDIDVLVEFTPGHEPGLAFFTFEAELTTLMGRKADLHTKDFLSRHIRATALSGAELLYAAA
ncbi:MAG: nucleotidyltransferase family protein [Acidobacteria bacterium]|nr:nucleotidyltransferase family protein [Acidobacteriota bacterium]